MDEFDNEDCFALNKTLLIDGDIVIYRPCCIHNEEGAPDQRQIAKAIRRKISELMTAAGCDSYRFFVTTKTNYRDHLVDDYKANRTDKERPVHLAWAKNWALGELGAEYRKYLEADDLLGINQTEDTVIWSLDKDLRQIPGDHLEDDTMQVITVDETGIAESRGKKVYFNGLIGFYYQLLIGDSTDHIVGCGKRVLGKFKSGPRKGEDRISRQGVGPKAAVKILDNAMAGHSGADARDRALDAVRAEYKKVFGKSWSHQLNVQANLLYMIREMRGSCAKMWTHDNKPLWLNIDTGMLCYGEATNTD